jgi:carboxymethylenebutenolidase
MRPIRFTLTVLTLALLTAPALAQLTGLKDHEKNTLNNAVDQHNQDLENAMNGNGNDNPNPQPAPTPRPIAPAANPDGTLPIKSGWLTRSSADGKTKTRLYFAYPQNLSKDAPAPGLLVLQEWWGVNLDIRERTEDFAKHGFYAVAPDLFHGQTTANPTEAAALKAALKNDVALINMKTGMDLFAEEASNGVVDPSRVGAIGWCMGGEQALLLSLVDPRVKATAIFYGPLVTDPDQLKNLQGPILGIFGNDDKAPSPDDVEKFKAALATAGKTDVTIYQFDGVGHAFASKSAAIMGAYNPDKAKDAWTKTWTWLNTKLLKK